jgi:hypothetical protein
MSLHGAPCHIELAGNFGIVTPLQQQIDNLLFARPQPNSLFLHSHFPLFLSLILPSPVERGGTFPKLIASTLPLLGKAAGSARKIIFHSNLRTFSFSPGPEKNLFKSQNVVFSRISLTMRRQSTTTRRQSTLGNRLFTLGNCVFDVILF